MEKKLLVCKNADSLNCFLSRAKGHYCFHSEPHEHTQECNEEICIKNDDKYYLRGCSCKVYEEKTD